MKYQEQKARMERLYKKINPESDNHGDFVEYEDNLWFFFQTAWHLKDWIKNDPEINNKGIEEIVENVLSLRICADLANRTKHHVLTKYIREDAKFEGNDCTVIADIATITYADALSGKVAVSKCQASKYNFWITDQSGERYPAIELANQIMRDWDEIIKNHVRPKI